MLNTGNEEEIQRLLKDASHCLLGNISEQARRDERINIERAIRDAINAGVTEHEVWLCLNNDQRGWPSEKVRKLLPSEPAAAA